jgi:hypothetical protein
MNIAVAVVIVVVVIVIVVVVVVEVVVVVVVVMTKQTIQAAPLKSEVHYYQCTSVAAQVAEYDDHSYSKVS